MGSYIRKTRSAYIFPLILLATLAVATFIATVAQLQVSHQKQYNHLNQYQHSFNIAYSALVELLADMKKKKWSNRSFKDKPVYYTKDLYGGTFNLLVENHATENLMFNVKIRVSYAGKGTLFYWRLKYDPNLLDFNTLVIPSYFGHFPDSTKPDYNSELDKIVDECLKKRNDNEVKCKEIVKALDKTIKIKDMLTQLGAIEKSSPLDIIGKDDNRKTKVKIELDPNQLSAKKLTDIINETAGASTPEVEDIIVSLPLTDIYPDKVDVNIGLSRKEIVVYFSRMLDLPQNSSADAIAAFPDITTDSLFNNALSPMAKNGIVVGYPSGMFMPDEMILRGHMAFLLNKIEDYTSAQLRNTTLSASDRRKFIIIRDFATANIPDFTTNNPDAAMTIGDGLSVLSDLQKKIDG